MRSRSQAEVLSPALSACFGVGFYALLCIGLQLGWVQPPPDQDPSPYLPPTLQMVYPLLLNALGMTVVALLSGYLAERLRLTGGALEEATFEARGHLLVD